MSRAYKKKERRRPPKRKKEQGPLPTYEATKARVLGAIGQLTPPFSTIQDYLAARTMRGDATWTLSEMARELGMPAAVFISFHAAWVDEQTGPRHAAG